MAGQQLPKQAILVVNTKSRRGRACFETAVSLLKERGIELLENHRVDDPARMQQVVKDAVASAPMVIVGGGDGTLSSTIDMFKGSDTVFGLLPLGTANSFARALEVPLDLPAAADVIAKGEQRRIDLGCIDGDYFGNSAVIGLSPEIAKTLPRKLKGMLGRAGYALWAIRVAARFKPFKLTVVEEDSETELWASEVRIANGGFFGGVELVEEADLESGSILVEVVATKTRRHLFASWISSAFKLRHREEGIVEFRARKLRLKTDPPMDVSIDGEPSGLTPIDVWVAPKAVAIAVPSRRG
jgi:YegS/Rv2252/BmrU family lipid kinase